MKARIMVLAGDGIGPEVTTEAVGALQTIAQLYGHRFEFQQGLIGAAAIDQTGEALPEATLSACRAADAILLGAVGDPRYDDPERTVRPEQGLLALRKGLNLFANLRPVAYLPALRDASPLKAHVLEGVDLVVVRELTGGLYFGDKTATPDSATDLCRYDRHEIERVVHIAARLAASRRQRLTLVDKANVLATSRLWRRVTCEIMARDYPDIEFETVLVDAMAMHLIQCPARFDVIVTENLFGDILTDEASVLAGSMGLLPSASLSDQGPGLFEPIHGSAPDLVGTDRANPFAAILSAAMLLRESLGLAAEAEALEAAIAHCLESGWCTEDAGGSLSTRSAGEAVRETLNTRQVRTG